MTITADFKTRFPEFDTATVDTYLPILEPVYPSYYALAYTDATKEATLQLIAHLLVGETASGSSSASSQVVASKSVGSVSVSYQANQRAGGELNDFFAGTKYGQRFMLLTARRYGGMAV